MKFTQVTVIITLFAYTLAAGYGSGSSGAGSYGSGSSGAGSYGGGSSRGGGSYSSEKSGPPKPYNFDYKSIDEKGNTHYRNEEGDQNGVVKGTYGYNDIQGLYRIVEYVADENGYRAVIKTNEPGVDDKESPADVILTAEQPPSGLAGAASSPGNYKSSASGSSSYGGFSGAAKPRPGSGKSGY